MAGSKFQYDESGGTFFIFLLSFLALLLVPSTLYLFCTRKRDVKSKEEDRCSCKPCLNKQLTTSPKSPKQKWKERIILCAIIIGWIAFFATVYKVLNLEREYVDFDPYQILQIDAGAPESEIKKAYRKLSLVYHPDKDTGDAKKFMLLTKAYAALTNAEARQNYEKYGNPDGPGAMSFGIALPSWIVEKENSLWVLGLYGLVFMIALPTVVGMWWYQSIKYGGDQVLMETSKVYYHFLSKTSNMNLKRVIMIMAGSLEFSKRSNSEVVERPSDDAELYSLMKDLDDLGEKNREAPLCFPYSMKARILLHAHFSRKELPPNTLDKDRAYIVKKCPYLLQEMIQCFANLTMLVHARRFSRMPSLETLQWIIRTAPMVVQGLWDRDSPLLQLPHFTPDTVNFLRKKGIRSIRQLAWRGPDERRNLTKNLTDTEYNNVMRVVANMPIISISAIAEVVDDEKPERITTGSIVTVTVTLSRRNVEVATEDGENTLRKFEKDSQVVESRGKPPVWQKQQKKKGKKVKIVQKKKKGPTRKGKASGKKNKDAIRDGDDSGDGYSSEDDGVESNEEDAVKKSNQEDDEEWKKVQARLPPKEKILETKSKVSHTVHCPYFPEEKQEYWWVYITDTKNNALMTAPYHVTNLVTRVEVPLKFSAPQKVGKYNYLIHLCSDSYLDANEKFPIKLHVQGHTASDSLQPSTWDISDDEEENPDNDSVISDSGETDSDDD